MGILGRLKRALSTDEAGVEYQCSACGETFDTAYERCPNCGESDIRERGSFEFEPTEGASSTNRR